MTQLDVVRELRAMFKLGATPSRLIRHIADRHPAEPQLHSLIQAYFQQAFRVSIVRGVSVAADCHRTDLHYAHLNEQLLQEMVENRREWDDSSPDKCGEEGWLESLGDHVAGEQMRQLPATAFPELKQTWERLSPKEQAFIQRVVATANCLHARVKSLSRLAECLQGRILELEQVAKQ